VLHRIIWSWYTGRWWVGCYIWYGEERPRRAAAPPSPLLTVPYVTAHPSTARVPITVLLYDGPLLGSFNVAIKWLKLSLKMYILLALLYAILCYSIRLHSLFDTYCHRCWCFCLAASKIFKLSSPAADKSRSPDSATRSSSQAADDDDVSNNLQPSSARPGSGQLIRVNSGFVNVPKTIIVDYPDLGRVDASTSHCKIVFVAGKKTLMIIQHKCVHFCLHTLGHFTFWTIFCWDFRWVPNSDWNQRLAKKWSHFFRLDAAIRFGPSDR